MSSRNLEMELEKFREEARGKAILEGRIGEFRQDGYYNLLTKYGTSQDSNRSYQYRSEDTPPDMEMTRMYESNGLFAKIIDRPAEEAMKHGYDFSSLGKLEDMVTDRLEELDWDSNVITALKWQRLYGGAIIVMITNDGRGLEEPLDWKRFRAIEELRVYERAIVQPDYSSLYSLYSPDRGVPYDQPEYYDVFSVYGSFRVHYSRCLIFQNGKLPQYTSNSLYRFWGIPEYVKIKDALQQTIVTHENGVKLLERSVQAIYKMKGLAAKLATAAGEDMVLSRLQLIDMARNFMNSIAIDNDGEDYNYVNAQMSGVKDIIDSTCNLLSAVTDMPQTILFGRSPAGENSTGTSDLENYYNMVERIQKNNLKKNTRTVVNMLLKQLIAEGEISGELPKFKIEFAPLWSLSDQEQANVDSVKANTEAIKANTANVYVGMGALDPEEVRAALARSEDYEIEDILSPGDGEELPEDLFNPPEKHDVPDEAMEASDNAKDNEKSVNMAQEPEKEAGT